MSHITVIPAYGRDYKNQKDAQADWDAGKDFAETRTRQYINKSQAKEMGLSVTIRYNKLQRVMTAK